MLKLFKNFSNFNSNYFGSVPWYADEEDKAKIDKIFLDFKNIHHEELFEDESTLGIPSIEQIIFYQAINLAKFNHNSGQEHFKASEDLFRYLWNPKARYQVY